MVHGDVGAVFDPKGRLRLQYAEDRSVRVSDKAWRVSGSPGESRLLVRAFHDQICDCGPHTDCTGICRRIASAVSAGVDSVWILALARGIEPIMCNHIGGERAKNGLTVRCVGAVRREVSGGVEAELCSG